MFSHRDKSPNPRLVYFEVIKILFFSNHAEYMEVTLFVRLCSHCRVRSARRTCTLSRTQSSSLDHQEYLKVNPVVGTCNVTEEHFRITHAPYSQ